MLTLKTRFTLAVIHDIYQPDYQYCDKYCFPSNELSHILGQLQSAGLIRQLPEHIAGSLSSYTLIKPYSEITLLDVLTAIDEGLRFNHKTDIDFYEFYGCLARKLAIVNQMTRLYLAEFHIANFPLEAPHKNKDNKNEFP